MTMKLDMLVIVPLFLFIYYFIETVITHSILDRFSSSIFQNEFNSPSIICLCRIFVDFTLSIQHFCYCFSHQADLSKKYGWFYNKSVIFFFIWLLYIYHFSKLLQLNFGYFIVCFYTLKIFCSVEAIFQFCDHHRLTYCPIFVKQSKSSHILYLKCVGAYDWVQNLVK